MTNSKVSYSDRSDEATVTDTDSTGITTISKSSTTALLESTVDYKIPTLISGRQLRRYQDVENDQSGGPGFRENGGVAMTRVHSESGAINILNVIIMLITPHCTRLRISELSAALDQQNAQTNDCSAARDATMASQNLLVAKNSDDPGLAIATAAVKSLRANGFNGEVEVWFYEAPPRLSPEQTRVGLGHPDEIVLERILLRPIRSEISISPSDRTSRHMPSPTLRERHGDRRIRVTESIPSKPVRTLPNTRSTRPRKSFRKK